MVYVEIDSIMPDRPEFDFLRDSSGKMKPIRTVRMRGQISQGVVFPLSVLPNYADKDFFIWAKEGTDVTELLGVTQKTEDEEPAYHGTQKPAKRTIYPAWFPSWLTGLIHGTFLEKYFRKPIGANTFPPFCRKTDETRVQVLGPLINKYWGVPTVATEKLDGSSITVYLNGDKFGVCSRNLEIPPERNGQFWDAVRRLKVEDKMRQVCGNNPTIALQGELIGPNIQGNKYGLKETTILWFNVWDIKRQQYLDHDVAEAIIRGMGLQFVPVVWDGEITIGINFIEMSKGNSALADVPREGIVVRPRIEIKEREICRGKLVGDRVSWKAINPDFLLKYGG